MGEGATDEDPVAHRVQGVDGGAGPAVDREGRVDRAVIGLALVELQGGDAVDRVSVHVRHAAAEVEAFAVGRHRHGLDRARRRRLRIERGGTRRARGDDRILREVGVGDGPAGGGVQLGQVPHGRVGRILGFHAGVPSVGEEPADEDPVPDLDDGAHLVGVVGRIAGVARVLLGSLARLWLRRVAADDAERMAGVDLDGGTSPVGAGQRLRGEGLRPDGRGGGGDGRAGGGHGA